MHEGERLSAKLLEKAYFIFKQVSSDKWIAPKTRHLSVQVRIEFLSRRNWGNLFQPTHSRFIILQPKKDELNWN